MSIEGVLPDGTAVNLGGSCVGVLNGEFVGIVEEPPYGLTVMRPS